MHQYSPVPYRLLENDRRTIVPGLLLLLLIALKIIYVFGLRIDSDETQHLHVVWGWANGLLPYRDLFDNHSPLFQFLSAPLFRLLGERPDIVIPMRVAMIPLYLVCLWIAYRIGTILFSQSAGLWAAVLAGAYPTFFLKSSEFRTDDLWAALWLVSMLVLFSRPLTAARAFFFGLGVGATFATSLKTTVLVAGLLLTMLSMLTTKSARGEFIDWRKIGRDAAFFLLGAAVLPILVISFFAFNRALPQLYYCTIQHNILHQPFSWLRVLKKLHWLGPLSLLSAGAGRLAWRNSAEKRTRDAVLVITLSLLSYFVLLLAFWPIVQAQDFIPVVPLIAVLLSGAVTLSPIKNRDRIVPPIFVAAELLVLLILDPPAPSALTLKEEIISVTLKLTTKDEFVMDAKGESVFRPRPFYYVMEGITDRRLVIGLINDDIPERLAATRTPMATLVRMPPRAHDFIEQNYVPIAFRTRVLGKMLTNDTNAGANTYEFNIAIPEKYVLVSENGDLNATLDGVPATGPQFLEAGPHRVDVSAKTGRLALIWGRAAKRGFSPFVSIPDERMRRED